MKQTLIRLWPEQYDILKDKYSSVSVGIRESLEELEKMKSIEEYSGKLEKLTKDLSELKEWMKKYSNNMYLENYISYLNYYAENRGLNLPSRIVYTNDPSLLEREKVLYNSMKENKFIHYKDRKFIALTYKINLEDYKYPTEDITEESYKVDLLVRSYDYRSIFLFISNVKGKIKLRTWNDYFIRKLRPKENGDQVCITIVINDKQKPEIANIS